MRDILKKFSSRKFIVAVTGVCTGIGLLASGNVAEGMTTIIASVVGYLVAEGLVDVMAVGVAKDVISKIEETTDDNSETGDGDDINTNEET